MNALLIHNDLLPTQLINQFNHTFRFDSSIEINGIEFDNGAHQQLSKTLTNSNYEVIFLPFSLSNNNSRDMSGLRVALHIRLSPELNHQYTPIVFIGKETKEQVAKLSDLGGILFTTGIFNTSMFDVQSLQKKYTEITQNWKPEGSALLNVEEYQRFLNRVHITPPANYQSHHSIDNELALLRWSEYLGCDQQIEEVKQRLQTGLYFKYIKALHPTPSSTSGIPDPIKGKASILLIDDEVKKGWGNFYSCLFKFNNCIRLDVLDIDYNSFSSTQITKQAEQQAKEGTPDVVLLDLRLCDADFSKETQSNPQQLTGYQVLKKVKELNQGIQVIITTASNKVWNYESVLGAGANGYILKQGVSDVKEDIKNLKNVLEDAIKKANYLKPTFEIVKISKNELEHKMTLGMVDESLGRELVKFLDMSYQMYSSASTKESFAFAYLSLFKCLELIANHWVYKENNTWKINGGESLKNYYWDHNNQAYQEKIPAGFDEKRSPSTFQKIAGCSFQLWEMDTTFVKQIYTSIRRRNEFIHPSKSELVGWLRQEVTKTYTPEGFQLLLTQLSEIVQKL